MLTYFAPVNNSSLKFGLRLISIRVSINSGGTLRDSI